MWLMPGHKSYHFDSVCCGMKTMRQSTLKQARLQCLRKCEVCVERREEDDESDD